MKKKYMIRIVCLTFISIWFCGCNRIEPVENDNEGFRFLINPPLSLDVNTKANTDPKLGSIAVNDVWIVQFNKETKVCLKCLLVTKDKITPSGDSGLLVELNTEGADFSNVASLFYIIVNGGSSLFSDEEKGTTTTSTLTETTLKSKTVAFAFPTNSNSLQTTEPALLTSGPIDYTPKENKIVVVSRMLRAFSKLSVTLNYTGTGVFEPSAITVNNIPQIMALCEAGGSSNVTTYPSTNNIVTSGKTFTQTWNNNTTGAMVFYMPENLRGAGTATTQKEKGMAAKGPGGSLVNCTYLTVEGTYKYESGHTGSVGVKYRFYLGGNFTDDYNIYRDYQYNMTINIKGINSADVRVSITDGNVAVFDEVDEYTNTVDF